MSLNLWWLHSIPFILCASSNFCNCSIYLKTLRHGNNDISHRSCKVPVSLTHISRFTHFATFENSPSWVENNPACCGSTIHIRVSMDLLMFMQFVSKSVSAETSQFFFSWKLFLPFSLVCPNLGPCSYLASHLDREGRNCCFNSCPRSLRLHSSWYFIEQKRQRALCTLPFFFFHAKSFIWLENKKAFSAKQILLPFIVQSVLFF